MDLLKNADLYAPEHLGRRDLLIEGERITRIETDLSRYEAAADMVTDLGGRRVVPGYIDAHIHITGGGGEQGPASRCPECPLTALTLNGVTSVLGLLGTDGTSRSVENLLYKCRALNEEGVTAWMLTGSYQYPSPVMTDSVIRDIALIDRVVGCKIALSDHRSSTLTVQELIRLASDVRMGGLISGKAGVLTIHMGSGKKGLAPLLEAIRESDIPVNTFWPTHMGRTPELLTEGLEFIRQGGTMDLTAGDHPETGVAFKLAGLLERGADIRNITMSSDAFGSQPRFDAEGNCVGLTYVSPAVLHLELTAMVRDFGIPLEQALLLLTRNPARMLKQEGIKGCLAPGADADLLVYDDAMAIADVYARGRLMVKDGRAVVRGRFE